jgi:hypothetical protein
VTVWGLLCLAGRTGRDGLVTAPALPPTAIATACIAATLVLQVAAAAAAASALPAGPGGLG